MVRYYKIIGMSIALLVCSGNLYGFSMRAFTRISIPVIAAYSVHKQFDLQKNAFYLFNQDNHIKNTFIDSIKKNQIQSPSYPQKLFDRFCASITAYKNSLFSRFVVNAEPKAGLSWYEQEAHYLLQEYYKKNSVQLPSCCYIEHIQHLDEHKQAKLIAFLYEKLVDKNDRTHFKTIAFIAEKCEKLSKYQELHGFFQNNKEADSALTVFNEFRTTLSGNKEKLPEPLYDANEEFKKTASMFDLTWNKSLYDAKFRKI